MTRKLYYEDVYQRSFTTEVLDVGEDQGLPYAVLRETCFYPEGGGQACDTGTLQEIQVLDVQEINGEIRHYLEQPVKRGDTVSGILDWEGRFHRMQQHLGQHILSAVVKFRSDANSVGVHFGEKINTLDFDAPLTIESIKAVEEEANAIIHRNVAVKTSFPDIVEITARSRKKIPLSGEPIRVVEIEEVDYITCCGTHPSHTGEVGLVKIFKQEAYKGGLRLFFSCGMAAYKKLSDVWEDTVRLQQVFSIGDGELPARVEKLIEEQRRTAREKQALVGRLSALEAKLLKTEAVNLGGTPLIAATVAVQDADELKALFGVLTKEPVIALLGGKLPEGGMLLFGSHKDAVRPGLRDIFREALESIGGKGGGSDVFSQGMSAKADATVLEKAVEMAKDLMLKTHI